MSESAVGIVNPLFPIHNPTDHLDCIPIWIDKDEAWLARRYELQSKSTPSVIVIGPDGVGKTTIVRRLSQMLGIPSFKCPSEKQIFRSGGKTSLTFDSTLVHFLEQTRFRFISDRGYPCEFSYSYVFGRETDIDLLRSIDTHHASLGTKILYLYSSILPFEEDDIVPMKRYSDIRNAYDNFVGWSECHVTAMDTAEMLTEYHVNKRDVSGLFAAQAIERMEIV